MIYESFEVPIPDCVEYPAEVDNAQSPASLNAHRPRLRKYVTMQHVLDMIGCRAMLGHTEMARIASGRQVEICGTSSHERHSEGSGNASMSDTGGVLTGALQRAHPGGILKRAATVR